MKRKLLSVVALLLFLGTVQAQEVDSLAVIDTLIGPKYVPRKVFALGDIVVEYGAGGVAYNTGVHSVGKVGGVDKTTDSTGVAGSFIYPISVEYGFRDWFGFGARYAFQQFVAEKDSITRKYPRERTYDFNLIFNFHFIKTKRFEMPISAIWGFSHYTKKNKDVLDSKSKGNGINGGLLFIPRFYIRHNFAIYVNFGVLNYAYPDVIFSNKNNSNLNKAGEWVISVGGSGGTFGFGGVIKF